MLLIFNGFLYLGGEDAAVLFLFYFVELTEGTTTQLLQNLMFFVWFSNRVFMQFPRDNNDLLIIPPSSRRLPVLLVFDARSEPARSIRLSLVILVRPSASTTGM